MASRNENWIRKWKALEHEPLMTTFDTDINVGIDRVDELEKRIDALERKKKIKLYVKKVIFR